MRKTILPILLCCVVFAACGGSEGWSSEVETDYRDVCSAVVIVADPSIATFAPNRTDHERICACAADFLQERYSEDEYLGMSPKAHDRIGKGAVNFCLVDLGFVE